jgi:hypothetical protein
MARARLAVPQLRRAKRPGVHHRHHQVEEDQVRPKPFRLLEPQRLRPIGSRCVRSNERTIVREAAWPEYRSGLEDRA